MSDPEPRVRGLTPKDRRLNGRIGGYKSWSRTTDRRERMKTPQTSSPAHVYWHARRLGFNLEDLDEEQLELAEVKEQFKQAEAARKQYFSELSRKARDRSLDKRRDAS